MVIKEDNQQQLRNIPSVNVLMQGEALSDINKQLNHTVLKKIVRQVLDEIRSNLRNGSLNSSVSEDYVIRQIKKRVDSYLRPSLKKVVNATGIPLNTNLGRAPLGSELIKRILPVITGYNNLEFNLNIGKRGNRNAHLKELVKLLFGCEDSVVVNNNAAAVYLTISALCRNREVIVSRGELVEIGGSFRIPDIINASGARLIEVGTTNKTKISDYENAITDDTAAILKVHKSNYFIGGFTEEVKLHELHSLAHKHQVMTFYDYGTGLPDNSLLGIKNTETDLHQALNSGADIVTFSCDKLLGGPQAGIIAGNSEHIKKIAADPLMRVLRVDKLIIASLDAALKNLLCDRENLLKKIPLYKLLNRSEKELSQLAAKLAAKISDIGIGTEIVPGKTQCGGGTLPDMFFDSVAVCLNPLPNNSQANQLNANNSETIRSMNAESIYHYLLQIDIPVVAVFREGKLMFDVFALEDDDIDVIVNGLKNISCSV